MQADELNDPGQPWSELTDDIIGLAERVKATYRRVADETGPSEDEIRQAFSTLAGAWNQMAGSVGAAFQDEDVRHHLRKAGSSLLDAIGATLSEALPDRQEDPRRSSPAD